MRLIRTRACTFVVVLALGLALASCIGTTGGDLVSFRAFAAGTPATTAQGLTFTNGRGWNITLTRAPIDSKVSAMKRPAAGAATIASPPGSG